MQSGLGGPPGAPRRDRGFKAGYADGGLAGEPGGEWEEEGSEGE